MRYASKNDIKQLIPTPEDSHAVSIFIPTHRISLPHNLKADRVRMKNAIRDVVASLEQKNVSSDDIKLYVEKLQKIHDDADFWNHRDNGLALYAQKGKLTYFDLPIEPEYTVHVNGDFIISPLLAMQQGSYTYHVLELNTKEPRYFVGSQSGLEQALREELPGDLETALWIDEYQTQRQHSTSPGGSRDAHSHGHGGKKDKKHIDIDRYYRLVNSVVMDKVLKNSNLPLILAGDSHTVAKFKEISRYKFICDEFIEGNHQHSDKDSLSKMSWSMMVDQIEDQERSFKNLFERAKHRDSRQALVNGAHIRKAAKQGRIATLAISIVHKTYDSVVRRMEKRFKIALPSSQRQLLNIENTAREVLMSGGEVRALLFNDSSQNANYVQAISR